MKTDGFATYVKTLLAAKGLRFKDLAEQAGVDLTLVSKVLNGHRRPTASFILRVAPVLQVPAAELLRLAGYHQEADTASRLAPGREAEALAPYLSYAATEEGQEEIRERFTARLSRLAEKPADGAPGRWAQLVQHLQDLYQHASRPGATAAARLLAGGALLYFLATVDAVPDYLPIVGLLDDLGVAAYALRQLTSRNPAGGNNDAGENQV